MAFHSLMSLLVNGYDMVPCTYLKFNEYVLILNYFKMLNREVNKRLSHKIKKIKSNFEKS